MAHKHEETLAIWLRDAHAMERATVDNLAKQVEAAGGYPELQSRYRQHLEESRRHVELVEQCLGRLGEETSAIKDIGMKVVETFEALSTRMARDHVVKNCLGALAFENFEIASYKALIATAGTCGHPEISTACEEILREEEAMAAWLKDHIAEVTRQYLVREDAAA